VKGTSFLRRFFTFRRFLMRPVPNYYGGLRGITEGGDWASWLQYFLNGVARQAEDALSRAERTNTLLEQWRHKLSSDAHAKVAFQMVDLLGANPFVTPRGAQQRLSLAYNTIMRAIRQLEKLGIVEEVSGAKRDRVYCAKKLLQIFEEPPQLKPAKKF